MLKKNDLTKADYGRIIQFSDSILRENPFDLRTLNYRSYAARKLGELSIGTNAKARINLAIDAILSTGDGKTIPSAFWVTEVSHEYFMLNVLGFEFGGSQSLVEGPCDYLTIKTNKWDILGLYFNVSISMGQLEEMFKQIKGKKKH